MKKIHARQITLKIFMQRPKKDSHKGNVFEKIHAPRKFHTLPVTFLMVRPLVGL